MVDYIVCLAHFCEVHGPCSIMCTQVSKTKASIIQSSSKLLTCSSCNFQLPNDATNLITKCSGQWFVSTQYSSSEERYTALTKLVMKSLSVETVSAITKPLFIGDNSNGFTLTKIFKIKDANARGGERKYCLMVVSDEESSIIRNWTTLSQYLDHIIESLQEKVLKVQETQLKSGSNNNDNYLRRSMVKPKSLIELTGDENTFVKLHLSATELIQDMI